MNITIIGCGYIGKELAKLWSHKGHVVTCTTRSPKNLPVLDKFCQKSIVIKASDENEMELLIEQNDLIVVTVASSSLEDYKNTYLKAASSIRHAALKFHTPKILFYTNSSSVYGEHKGRFVDENSSLLSTSEQGKILIETEKTFLSLQELGWKICIFRLSEIYGPGRDFETRMKKLQGHVIPGTGLTYTNMIHREDIVGALNYALNHKLEGIYNLADDDHPLRKEFYNYLCDQLKLDHVTWDANLKRIHPGNKRISNHKMKAAGYKFQFPNRELT